MLPSRALKRHTANMPPPDDCRRDVSTTLVVPIRSMEMAAGGWLQPWWTLRRYAQKSPREADAGWWVVAHIGCCRLQTPMKGWRELRRQTSSTKRQHSLLRSRVRGRRFQVAARTWRTRVAIGEIRSIPGDWCGRPDWWPECSGNEVFRF